MKVDNYIEDQLREDTKNSRCMGIVLGTKLKKRLRKIAEKEDRPLSYVIRVLLVEALEARNIK